MKLTELGESIKTAELNIAATTRLIEDYFNSGRFRSLDAEERNRQIESTKQGLKFYFLREGLKESRINQALNEAFAGLTNRLDYSPVRRGRPEGFSPINGESGAMTKKSKAWSMPKADWEWLESQPNQSEIIREAIALYRQQQN